MTDKRNFSHWKNSELDDYIQSYCPNLNIPNRRASKISIVKQILLFKKMMPMVIPHPEEEGKHLKVSLDTFMQGEKL